MVRIKNRFRKKLRFNCRNMFEHTILSLILCVLRLPAPPLKVTLTADHEKMEAEVTSLRSQLETEKSRYRKMQSDLQRELNVAFDENTKLTSLLDGKVPKSRF